MSEAVEVLRNQEAVVGRIVSIEGFSTRPGDDLVAIDRSGSVHGSLLAGLGGEAMAAAARSLLAGAEVPVTTVTVDVGDKQAVSAGLACGGRAQVLLQVSSMIPSQLWELLTERRPAALVTRLEAAPAATVLDREGRTWGAPIGDDLLAEAVAMVRAGRTDRRQVEQPGGSALIESWVPDPRVVVVGSGELVAAIAAQAGLLGWETRSASSARADLAAVLDWAGGSSALVVLSHDPHVDTPALAEGIGRGVPYIGALGSRSTQARRTERLLAGGVAQSDIDGIHRPIGLDLGGRRAPEVALAIVAEILASHCGRDARPLSLRDAPIHG